MDRLRHLGLCDLLGQISATSRASNSGFSRRVGNPRRHCRAQSARLLVFSLLGILAVKFALQITPHVFVRPDELRHAEWSEFDIDKAISTVPAGTMKAHRAYVVLLSRQVLALLPQLQEATSDRV